MVGEAFTPRAESAIHSGCKTNRAGRFHHPALPRKSDPDSSGPRDMITNKPKIRQAENELPHEHVRLAFGLMNRKPPFSKSLE